MLLLSEAQQECLTGMCIVVERVLELGHLRHSVGPLPRAPPLFCVSQHQLAYIAQTDPAFIDTLGLSDPMQATVDAMVVAGRRTQEYVAFRALTRQGWLLRPASGFAGDWLAYRRADKPEGSDAAPTSPCPVDKTEKGQRPGVAPGLTTSGSGVRMGDQTSLSPASECKEVVSPSAKQQRGKMKRGPRHKVKDRDLSVKRELAAGVPHAHSEYVVVVYSDDREAMPPSWLIGIVRSAMTAKKKVLLAFVQNGSCICIEASVFLTESTITPGK
ncbi:hypothetical protein KIPB_000789 [Kipferlia bialata]|uniref:Uncharacterized protein n=1 Tax=Kipferlia bialata TaxID=797122 RepID=A0A9K3GEZ4_9EUKA|nr:hypothetical protein KIPB_000789 [Kipferlia bialata]|eukprot:g789.t1